MRDDLFDLMLTIEAYESTTPAVRASVTRGGVGGCNFDYRSFIITLAI